MAVVQRIDDGERPWEWSSIVSVGATSRLFLSGATNSRGHCVRELRTKSRMSGRCAV